MPWLMVIFIPPLYLAARRKWGAFIFNGVLYCIAVIFVLTIMLAPVGLVFWVLAAGHAGWHLRKELMMEQAQMIAKAISEKRGGTGER